MPDQFAINQKNILVVGATSGLGKDFAHHAIKHGAFLAVTGRNEARLEELKQSNVDLIFNNSKCDINSASERQAFIVELNKPLDGVIFYSGVTEYAPLKFQSPESINRIVNTNFTSVILFLQELIKKRKMSHGCSVVLLSSVSAKRAGAPAISIYAATKGALESAVRVLSLEFAKSSIRINAVAPGIVLTPMVTGEESLSKNELIEEEKKYPLGFGSPRDVSNLVHFLISDASKWITGQTITIDGGYSNS